MKRAALTKERPSHPTLDTENPQTEETTEEEDLAQKMRTATTADIGAELIRRAAEMSKIVETSRNLKSTQEETLKEVARTITAGTTELVRRIDPAIVALAIRTRRSKKSWPRPPPPEKSSDTARLAAIEHELGEIRPSLHRLEERLQNMERREEKEVAPDESARRVETGAPNAPSTKGGQAAATEWQTVGKKRKKNNRKKKGAEKKQSAKPTPGTEAKSPRKSPESGSENARREGGKMLLPHTPRSSAVTITLTDKSGRSYEEVLAAARNSVSLAEIGISTMRMRKRVTGGVILEVPEDQERKKAAALAASLTRALDPNKVRVATPFRAAEVRVSMIDVSATKEEIRNTLAKESGCKPEDVRLGKIHPARNGLGFVWIRGPASAVRKLAQAGKVAIGWSTARAEAIARRPLQCCRCLEIGHVRKFCTAKEGKGHLCFRCSKPGHQAKACTAASPKCLPCETLGAPSGHRMGGPACAPPPKKGTKGAPRIHSCKRQRGRLPTARRP
ncbi:uncharacterized protein LOC117216180 [Bombus bifarius]|uniref:Uncharacterized protein LOC117216180 n=1 Tax=Bombus bifarius TaxID=103933 RepID=A0A6P8NBV6_9HYME|nr:uncharacterized protein LOC117216180 [Bombus bifarius]